MASSKFYAYYVRGRKIALIQHDYTLGSGQTLSQPGLNAVGARGDVLWKSPTESIASGLEIEYTYSPRYSLADAGEDGSAMLGRNKIVTPGWFISLEGYVQFLIPSETLATDPSVSGAWTAVDADDHIVITNSQKWNGLHKVKSAGLNGIETYTKPGHQYDTGPLSSTISDVNTHSDGYIHADDSSDVWVNLILSVGDFVHLGSATSGDNGLYKVTSITETDAGAESTQLAYLGTKYFLNPGDDIDEIQTGDSHLASDIAVSAFKVKYDPCYLISDVDVLDDESDTIDLPEYLAKALVYYVKAKRAEDRMDLEQKEYNMREFKRLLEKNESSKIWGARRIGTDETAIK